MTWQEFIREGGDYDYMATLISNKTYRVTIKEESVKKIIMIALLAAITVRGGTGTLTFDWIHADTAAALAAGTDRDRPGCGDY